MSVSVDLASEPVAPAGLGTGERSEEQPEERALVADPLSRGGTYRLIVGAWLVSRLLGLASIVGAARVRPTLAPRGIIRGFLSWDSQWYVGIARVGYRFTLGPGRLRSYPFFPLLPALLRAGRAVGVPSVVTGVVVAHLAFLVALFGVHRLMRAHFSQRACDLAVWSLALFPAGVVFSKPYPDAVFLAACVWAFVLVEEDKDGAAGLLAAAAALSRPNGVLLAIGLVFAVGSWRRAVVVAGPALIALAGWMITLGVWTGNPLAFVTAKAAWKEVTVLQLFRIRAFLISPAVAPLLLGMGAVLARLCVRSRGRWPRAGLAAAAAPLLTLGLFGAGRYGLAVARGDVGTIGVASHVAVGAVALVALVVTVRRIPRAWTVFGALVLLPPFALGVVGLARYANHTFPVFVSSGLILERLPRPARVVVLTLMGLAALALGIAFASSWIVL